MTVSEADQVVTFTLSPDNPCNTTISRSPGEVVYSIVTENTNKATFTTVRDAGDEIIGSLEWRDLLPDRVAIGSSKAVSLWDWLKKSRIPFKDYASFADDQGRKYKWKGLAAGSTPYLTSEDDNFASSIARFTRARRIYTSTSGLSSPSDATLRTAVGSGASILSFSPTLTDTASITPTLTESISPSLSGAPERRFTPATLDMLPRAIEIQDLVVMSFLFLEKNRRTRDQGGLSNERVLYANIAPMSAC
ncbi:hypothetical protein BDY19DRAFT_935240 [Irpex rosettiformis]|uniref:Uncharacterized protein n=1 Tax=Irpex rosettiformis TaxID=378272 RepID=A0ACB8UAR8_9APHY|nr:hypothetical protein BDY19DRAFT_935240 [Irpex rosettiformis]